jgi:hypothetical protein
MFHWQPRNSPPPPHLDSYTRALLVSQDRRHLFVPGSFALVTVWVVRPERRHGLTRWATWLENVMFICGVCPAELFPTWIQLSFNIIEIGKSSSYWSSDILYLRSPHSVQCAVCTLYRGGIQERTVGLRFLGIILRVLGLEVSTLVPCLSTRCSSWTDLSFLHWLIVLYGFLKP